MGLLVAVFPPTVCGLLASTAQRQFRIRRHCSRGGTRRVTVLCSLSCRRLPCCGAEANPHGLRDSPVAVHVMVDVSVVQLQPVSQVVDMPVGVQRQVPGGFGVQKTLEVPQLPFFEDLQHPCRGAKAVSHGLINIFVVHTVRTTTTTSPHPLPLQPPHTHHPPPPTNPHPPPPPPPPHCGRSRPARRGSGGGVLKRED